MRRLLILSLTLCYGCWTVQPTAVQKKERLDRATYQAKTVSGERIGGDNAYLLADSLIFTFNEIEWRNGAHIDSLAELNIASSGLGGLSGLLLGGVFGSFVGAWILGAIGLPSIDGDENLAKRRLLGTIGGFIVGIPVGMLVGTWVGTRLDEGTTLDFRKMTRSEKFEALKEHLSE